MAQAINSGASVKLDALMINKRQIMKHLKTVAVVAMAVALSACNQGNGSDSRTSENSATPKAAAKPIQVYSSRKEHLIKPLFDRYTAATGIEINYITDKEAPLIARLEAEGASTPADMFITVDVGNLWLAAQKDLFQSIESPALEASVPASMRDQQNRWFGLSKRARTMVYNTNTVDVSSLSTYEALAGEQWANKLCLRTSKKVYNQSLVGSMIAADGVEQAEQTVKGWVANLAVPPFSNDTKAIEAVAQGICDVTIVNTYYFGRLIETKPNLPVAIFWPNQQDRGVHVNLSGAGVTKHAKNPGGAQALIEWLASPEAQVDFAGLNKEYPVNPAVSPVALVASWGTFKEDDANLLSAGANQVESVQLMDRAQYK